MNIRKATYLGESALGFVTGEKYKIEIRTREVEIIPLGETVSHIYVYDVNGSAWYPYRDKEEMMKNWRFV